ncbi:molybdopterin biosynthesis enzyme [Vibrio cholerae]|nr:molybdopterin biosynthesis enzyme [Vibrio cholerae]
MGCIGVSNPRRSSASFTNFADSLRPDIPLPLKYPFRMADKNTRI